MNYKVIGLMSGTSLDGLDIACCEFSLDDGRWNYKIHCAETVPYSDDWKKRLSTLETGSALEYVTTDIEYGHLLGELARDFITRHNLEVAFIASHGHTIFHQPGKRITSQIGRGSAISAEAGLPVVCDFRSLDVALGGQGAPLVPIGDALLFSEYGYCLNIGGFANISLQRENKRVACDICPANIVMNQLAGLSGYEYDPEGMMAASGTINAELLAKLNGLPYYRLAFPKSLGKEWVIENIHPILNQSGIPVNDQLATFCEHIAMQVGSATTPGEGSKLFITGGGAFNTYLIERIRHYSQAEIILPDANTINYKEALIFAFLGVLRWRNDINCLKSVTGSAKDSSGGAIY